MKGKNKIRVICQGVIVWLLTGVFCFAQTYRNELRNVGSLTGGEKWLGFESGREKIERVLILGSSTAAGAGASSPQSAWAGILANKLAPLGGLLINSSVGGSTTRESRDRFVSEFNRIAPDVVVFATNPYNSPNLMSPDAVVDEYMSETRELVALTVNAGSIPVVITPYGYQNASEALTSAMLRLRDELEGLGCLVWDFWNSTTLESGKWIPGLNFDVLHPNDRGHQAMADSISVPQVAFGRTYYRDVWGLDGEPFGVTPNLGSGSDGRLVCRLGQVAQSWTITVRLRSRDVGVGHVRLLLGKETPHPIEIVKDGVHLPSGRLAWPANVLHGQGSAIISISFEAVERTFNVSVDGRVVQTTKLERPHSIEEFTIEANCDECVVDELVVHLSSLSTKSIEKIHSGQIPRASIVALIRFEPGRIDVVARQLVPSGASVELESDSWTVVRQRRRSDRERDRSLERSWP